MDIFETLRLFKIGPFAIFDFVISYLGIYLLAPALSKLALKIKLHISRTQWLWLVLPLSILIHLLFGQRTPLTQMVINPNNFYLLKILIIFMLFMGLKDTKVKKNNYELHHKP